MKKMIVLMAIVSSFALGCAPRYPTTNVSTVDSRPTFSFKNAPQGSTVLVDGISIGEASKFNGNPEVLAVEPGTHDVKITENGKVIFEQIVFVESEHKVINVH